MTAFNFVVTEEDANTRLDIALTTRLPDWSRMQIQRHIREGGVSINNQRLSKPAYQLTLGDRVEVYLPQIEFNGLLVMPQTIPFDILYEDEFLVALNKPAGLVVHPAYGHLEGTLVNGLVARYPFLKDRFTNQERAGIVHRLDKDTSGVILVALSIDAQMALMEKFRLREVQKTYWGLVEGRPKTERGHINAPIRRTPNQYRRMMVAEDGKPAITDFHTVTAYAGYTLLEMHPVTGRTHQIRVHMAFIGCPIVGDVLYGTGRQKLLTQRHFLHAREIAFEHPFTQQAIRLRAELPPELEEVLKELPPAK